MSEQDADSLLMRQLMRVLSKASRTNSPSLEAQIEAQNYGRMRQTLSRIMAERAAALNAAEENKHREGLLERAMALLKPTKVRSIPGDELVCDHCCAIWPRNEVPAHIKGCRYGDLLAEYQLTKGESDD